MTPQRSHSDARTYYERVLALRSNGKTQRMARCPFHEDGRASLSVNLETGLWNCKAGCGSGTQGDFEARLAQADEKPNRQTWTFASLSKQGRERRKPEAEYIFEDASGNPVFRKLRYPGKEFCLQRWDGGSWADGLEGGYH